MHTQTQVYENQSKCQLFDCLEWLAPTRKQELLLTPCKKLEFQLCTQTLRLLYINFVINFIMRQFNHLHEGLDT